MMDMLYYTLAGVFLYFASDWILERIELARGARLPQRNLVFFVIILLLSMGTFHLIQALLPVPPTSG
ncbi:MAG: hypothetical protein H7835_04290 [Magnetococcus sp. XQGC-1]